MTGADPGVCYRHPGRASWVLCQRCGRTICPQCQTQASVGVQCPECVAEQRSAQRATHQAARRSHGQPTGLTRWFGRPTAVTTTIVAVTAVAWIAQLATGNLLTQLFAFQPDAAVLQPWRLVTVALVHGGLLHLLFNMYALWILGQQIEQRLGRGPFLAAYVLCAAAGSVAVPLLGSQSVVVGASGAVFGLFGLVIGLQRMLGGVNPQLLIVVGINLALGFVLGGIAWQAHVGGLLAGLAIALGTGWIAKQRPRMSPTAATWAAIGAVAVLVAGAWIGWIALR